MSGSYTHVCKHPAQNERCGIKVIASALALADEELK